MSTAVLGPPLWVHLPSSECGGQTAPGLPPPLGSRILWQCVKGQGYAGGADAAPLSIFRLAYPLPILCRGACYERGGGDAGKGAPCRFWAWGCMQGAHVVPPWNCTLVPAWCGMHNMVHATPCRNMLQAFSRWQSAVKALL